MIGLSAGGLVPIHPTCVPLTACTNTMQRTVYNAYQGGRLVAVHPYYATEITYHPNGMLKQVTHARRGEQVSAGIAERIDADPNAMGRPYRISIGGTTTFNLRGLDGALRREYIYRDGLLLASQHRSEGHQHYALSHLGTTRMLTNRCGERVKRYDLFPYGADTISAPANDTETRRFTGHQRDLGSPTNTTDDLEYMHARYYGVTMGRFVSVDPGFDVNTHAPRNWNFYALVRYNPTRYVDTTDEGLGGRLYGTAQGILGSVSWGMMPNTAPSPLDTPDQREGQLWGAAIAAWAGIGTGKAGVGIALTGGLGEILTGGAGTLVAGGVVGAGAVVTTAGGLVVAGAAQCVAFATSKTEHGEQRHQEARDGDTHREVGDANRVKLTTG